MDEYDHHCSSHSFCFAINSRVHFCILESFYRNFYLSAAFVLFCKKRAAGLLPALHAISG